MRIFLDANILFSASLPQSRMQTLLKAAIRHGVCLTNDYAVQEARRNLQLKFPENIFQLDALLGECEIISAAFFDIEVELASKDWPILRGAIAGKATHLLTGDRKDFGAFWGTTVQNVNIVSPKMCADEFIGRGWL